MKLLQLILFSSALVFFNGSLQASTPINIDIPSAIEYGLKTGIVDSDLEIAEGGFGSWAGGFGGWFGSTENQEQNTVIAAFGSWAGGSDDPRCCTR